MASSRCTASLIIVCRCSAETLATGGGRNGGGDGNEGTKDGRLVEVCDSPGVGRCAVEGSDQIGWGPGGRDTIADVPPIDGRETSADVPPRDGRGTGTVVVRGVADEVTTADEPGGAETDG